MSEKYMLDVNFSLAEKQLMTLNPGDIFFDGSTLWITVNRVDDGYLVKLAGVDNSMSAVMSGDQKIFQCVKCENLAPHITQ